MQIAFYGVLPQSGTSASMKVVQTVLHWRYPASKAVRFLDCSRLEESELAENFEKSDLIILYLSKPCALLGDLCVRYSLVRKNSLFLIGNYFTEYETEYRWLETEYRIGKERICTIPYNLYFQRAYETRNVETFVKKNLPVANTYEEQQFFYEVGQAVERIWIFLHKRTMRKGE